jgi:hypothetical protein
MVQKMVVPPTPLTDAEVAKTLTDMEDVIRYRLRMSEIIPVEMSQYRIGSLSLPNRSVFLLIPVFSQWSGLFYSSQTLRNFSLSSWRPAKRGLVLCAC